MIKQSRCLQKATLHYDQLCLSSHAFLVSPVPTAVHGVLLLYDGRLDNIQPILLTEMYSWSCWRFNIAVKVQQQQQQLFYTINVDPFKNR